MARKAKTTPADPKSSTEVVVGQLSAESAHGALGGDLVQRISSSVKVEDHGKHPGHSAHPRGYTLGENVKSLAHIYTPWANLRANGSGILALAAWQVRLESEGKPDEQEPGDSGDFTRGLTHR
jgi:hypothetical protein